MTAEDQVLVCDAEHGLLRLTPRTAALEILHAMRFASNAVADDDGSVYGLPHWRG